MSAVEKPIADGPAKPLPDLDDPVTAEYWRATHEHRLVAPRCTSCGYRFWPPEVVCPECQERDFAWEAVGPTGTLWSFATYHRALDPAFADEVPYTVGLVDLGGGIRMYGIVRAEPEAIEIGARLTAAFEQVAPGTTMVRWRPAEGSGRSADPAG
jgi:uncharacterized OB-fold protein